MLAVVIDNGPKVVSPVHKSGGTHFFHFSHTLNSVVKDAIKAIPVVVWLLEKCSSIVSFFQHSMKALQNLTDIQKQLNVAKHKLV